MALLTGSLQTAATDSRVSGILDGTVTSMDVLDPTEGNEKTSLLEVNDEFDVRLTWQLAGSMCFTVGGYWVVELYSNHLDGVGAMQGLIGGPAIIKITPGPSPLHFHYTFRVTPPKPKAGLYTLTAVINHSPTERPIKVTEMFGYAESSPVRITDVVAETPADQ